MWQQSRPNIKYELLIGINGGVSQKGKIWGWKRKYSGCLDFYSDVHEDSNDIWSPVILVQYGRHLGVLANKVIKNLKVNCNIFRSLIISILLLTICFFIHIFNLNLNKVVWFIRNFGILKEDFRKKSILPFVNLWNKHIPSQLECRESLGIIDILDDINVLTMGIIDEYLIASVLFSSVQTFA